MEYSFQNKNITHIKAKYEMDLDRKNIFIIDPPPKQPDWAVVAHQRKLLRDEIRKFYALLRNIALDPTYNLNKYNKKKTIHVIDEIKEKYEKFITTINKYEVVEYLLTNIVESIVGKSYTSYPLKKGILSLTKPGLKKPRTKHFYNITYIYSTDSIDKTKIGDIYLSARIKSLESLLLKGIKGYRSFNDVIGINPIFNGLGDEEVQELGYKINEHLLNLGFESLPRSAVKIKHNGKEGEVFAVIYKSSKEKLIALYADNYEIIKHNRKRGIYRQLDKGITIYTIKNNQNEYWIDFGNNKGMLLRILEYEELPALLENVSCLVSRYFKEKNQINEKESFEISSKNLELIPWGHWYANGFERIILNQESLETLLSKMLPPTTSINKENISLNIRNYFQNPKKNGYKSFHINLALSSGEGSNVLGIDVRYVLPFIEMQVLTLEAYANNELGTAAHKQYKEITLGHKIEKSIQALYKKLIPCNISSQGGIGRKKKYLSYIASQLKKSIEKDLKSYSHLRLTYP